MPTLHWIGKDIVINHHLDVPYRVLEHSYGFDNGVQSDKETNSGNKIIHEIGNMQNISFWTRNIERRGYRINGFINHYPDFIVRTKSGKTVIVETKGDHLDAEQKIRLGSLWASKAGNDYRYFMVYDKRSVDGAYKLEDFLGIVKEI